jgi:ligand-binding sensor domain-containing protein
LGDSSVTTIAQDNKGNLWFGTNNGIRMLAPGSNTFKQYKHSGADNHSLSSNIIYSIAAEPNGNIWIGTEEGLNILNHQPGIYTA